MKNKIAKILISFLFVASAAAFLYLNTCGMPLVSSSEVLENGSEMINSSGSLPDVRLVELLVDVLSRVFTIR